MVFNDAFNALHEGKFVSRRGWEGTFLWLKPATDVKAEWCKDPILLMLAKANGGAVKADDAICRYSMRERKVITGWVPMGDDMAAKDWEVVTVEYDEDNGLSMTIPHDKNPKPVQLDLFDGADVFKKP